MNMDAIESFIEIIRYGSFTEASKNLYVPQPTLSHRMNQLEKDLGEKLIKRDNKGIHLTKAGETFLPFAMQVFEGYSRGKKAIEVTKMGIDVTYNIGISLALCQSMIPSFLSNYLNLNLDSSMNLYVSNSDMIIQSLKNQELEIGFTRYTVNDESLVFDEIYKDPICLIVPPHHPFTKRESVTLEEACSETLILYREGSNLRNMVEAAIFDLNLTYKTKVEANHSELIKFFVKSNLGITFLPESYVDYEVKNKQLMKINLADNPFSFRHTYIAYHKQNKELFIEKLIKQSKAYFNSPGNHKI